MSAVTAKETDALKEVTLVLLGISKLRHESIVFEYCSFTNTCMRFCFECSNHHMAYGWIAV